MGKKGKCVMATEANSGYRINYNVDGPDFIIFNDGRIVPSISGGRSNPSIPPEDDEPDEGPGAGGGSRTYTQEEFNHHMGGLRRNFDKQMLALTQRLDERDNDFNELVEALSEAVGDEENTGGADDEEPEEPVEDAANVTRHNVDNDEVARLRSSMNKMNRQLEQVQNQLKSEQAARESEHQKRLDTERDSLITQALTEGGAIAVKDGIKLFRDGVVYDQDKERWWYIEPETGAKLDIIPGIKENIPDYMKPSKMKTGGSGGRGSRLAEQKAQSERNLATLKDRAAKTGSPQDINEYMAEKKRVASEANAQVNRPGGQGPQTVGVPAEE